MTVSTREDVVFTHEVYDLTTDLPLMLILYNRNDNGDGRAMLHTRLVAQHISRPDYATRQDVFESCLAVRLS